MCINFSNSPPHLYAKAAERLSTGACKRELDTSSKAFVAVVLGNDAGHAAQSSAVNIEDVVRLVHRRLVLDRSLFLCGEGMK